MTPVYAEAAATPASEAVPSRPAAPEAGSRLLPTLLVATVLTLVTLVSHCPNSALVLLNWLYTIHDVYEKNRALIVY